MATTQNTAALLKAQDLQVAKLGSSAFAMVHKMGLTLINLTQKTVKTSRTVTYNSTYPNGNISDGSSKSVRASGNFKTNIMWNKDNANACYFIVKPNQTWTFDCTESTTAENVWIQDFDCTPTAGKYYSYNAAPRDYLTYIAIFAHRTAGYTFTIPMYACYKLEVWGASGGGNQPANPIVSTSAGSCGGLGGYSYGHKSFAASNKIYVYIGGQGKTTESAGGTGSGAYGGGWNGGGNGFGYLYYTSSGGGEGYGGGGMTHISTTQNPSTPVSSTWSPSGTLIVAGGGGGADDVKGDNAAGTWRAGNDGTGGYGGGSQGGQGTRNGMLVTSDSPAPYMYGGDNTSGATYPGFAQGIGQSAWGADTGGGGAGWYGGYASNFSSGGGGGTGYVENTGNPRATIAGNPEASTATIPKPGSFTSTSNVKGNWGNGFARITFAWVSRVKFN